MIGFLQVDVDAELVKHVLIVVADVVDLRRLLDGRAQVDAEVLRLPRPVLLRSVAGFVHLVHLVVQIGLLDLDA